MVDVDVDVWMLVDPVDVVCCCCCSDAACWGSYFDGLWTAAALGAMQLSWAAATRLSLEKKKKTPPSKVKWRLRAEVRANKQAKKMRCH